MLKPFLTLSLATTALAAPSHPSLFSRQSTCYKGVYIIGARGAGEDPGFGSTLAVTDDILAAIPNSGRVALTYDSIPYSYDAYQAQNRQGVEEAKTLIATYARNCKGGKVVLVGFSKGGNVITDLLGGDKPIDATLAQSIAAVTVFGDPTYTYGQPYDQGTATFSSGILGPRSAASLARLNAYSSKLRSFCRFDDIFCAKGLNIFAHGQEISDYKAAAVSFIKSRVLITPGGTSRTVDGTSTTGPDEPVLDGSSTSNASANTTADSNDDNAASGSDTSNDESTDDDASSDASENTAPADRRSLVQRNVQCFEGPFVIGVRGSTEDPGFGGLESLVKNITQVIPKSGSQALDYPAAAVDLFNLPSYYESVKTGVKALNALIEEYASKCAGKIVLLGFSQGAHVVTDSLAGEHPISLAVGSHISAAAVFGDPTFSLGQSYDVGTNKEYDGVSGPRNKTSLEHLDKYAERLRSYCNQGDGSCDRAIGPIDGFTGRNLTAGVHSNEMSIWGPDALEFIQSLNPTNNGNGNSRVPSEASDQPSEDTGLEDSSDGDSTPVDTSDEASPSSDTTLDEDHSASNDDESGEGTESSTTDTAEEPADAAVDDSEGSD